VPKAAGEIEIPLQTYSHLLYISLYMLKGARCARRRRSRFSSEDAIRAYAMSQIPVIF